MFNSLILGAVCLISHACTFNSGSVNNDYRNNSNDSNFSRVNEVKAPPLLSTVSNSYNNTIIYGTYNLKTEFNFDNFEYAYSDLSIVFEEEDSFEYLNPLNVGDNNEIYYLSNMSFDVIYDVDQPTEIASIYVYYEYYDSQTAYDSYAFYIYNHSYLSHIQYLSNRSLFFDVLGTVYVNNPESRIVFDSIFTRNDNSYVVTVNSYYSFTNYTSGINHLNCFGSIVFNNNMCVTLTTLEDGNTGNLGVKTMNYDALSTHYVFNNYWYPINFEISTQNAIYFNGTKMSVTSYNNLSSIGVFAYVHDTTYDNTDFHDLLFSIADTPLYFIFRLLDWQLFGMNLFIAFAGLLTLAVVLVCIRRFF